MSNIKQVKLSKGLFGYDEDMIFTIDESGDFYRYCVEKSDGAFTMSYNTSVPTEVIESLIASGDVEVVNTTITGAIDFINEKIEEYKKIITDANRDYNNGLLQTCVKVELETVNYNMIKVLSKVRELLENE